MAGVVTHKVPFTATSDYNGEYNFNIHGLHYIDASEEFREWNKDKKVSIRFNCFHGPACHSVYH